jgi:hypothetical protein
MDASAFSLDRKGLKRPIPRNARLNVAAEVIVEDRSNCSVRILPGLLAYLSLNGWGSSALYMNRRD